ncbi:PBP1A family penicillin-binding protein [Rhodobacterales bacterium HKCCE3408]|nr:PBP1A family penicillin-binding protein [Rhodobacterales bacterium HKCCE3408]
MIRFVFSAFGAVFTALTNGLVMAAIGVGGVIHMYSRDLPDHETLARYTPATISRVYSGEGLILDEFAHPDERRIYVPAEEIPELVINAFISAEDADFFEHGGYDPQAIISAVVDLVESRGENVRGASTITQQVAKNLLLSSDRNIERKIREIILAVRMEQSMSKEQILEVYLNEISFGLRASGVAAAAQTYFNATLSELTPGQAAYLAGLPQQPSNLHPVDDYDAAVARRNYVLREMWENGYITEEVYVAERDAPLRTVQSGDIERYSATERPRSYFTDEIRRQLETQFGQERFQAGGYAVRATIDESLQDAAEAALRDALESYDRDQGRWRGPVTRIDPALLTDEASWRAALVDADVPRDIDRWLPAVVLEVGDRDARIGIEGVAEVPGGHVIPADDVTWARPEDENGNAGNRAQVAGDLLSVGDVVLVRALNNSDGSFRRWSLRQVPEVQGGFMAMDVNTGRVLAMQGGFSFEASEFNRATQATRQPGSSFKPFVYAAALDSGYSPNTIVIDAPIEVETAEGIWRPENASREFYGPAPLRTGIERSRNLMTVRLAQDVGMSTVARYAERFGVYDRMTPYLANALGSQETTLYRMVAAYAMFANGGERVEPTLIDRVQDRFGTTVYSHDQRTCTDCELEELEPGLGPRIVSNRERVMDPITAYQLTSMLQGVVQRGTAAGRITVDVPIAGKTGTTNDARDVWFVGFSSTIVAGCYIGFDQPRTLGRGASGGGMCAPVFNEFMQTAVAEYGGGPFDVPPGGHFYPIDRYSGQRLPDGSYGEHVVQEYFRDGMEPSFGLLAIVDGGFGMGSNLPMFNRGENPDEETVVIPDRQTVTTSTGGAANVPTGTDFGTISSGGLY